MIKCQLLWLSLISIFFPLKVAIAEFDATKLEAVTVRIDVSGDSSNGGSGVIIERQGQSYTILTAYHVVETKRRYDVLIINPTNRQVIGKYTIDSSRDTRQINNYDLAEIHIKSNANYPIAEVGDSNQLQKTNDITILGYPLPSSGFSVRTNSPTIYQGKVSNIESLSSLRKKDGTTLKLGVVSDTGMSGGAVFNSEGALVGILNKGDRDGQTHENNSSLAIPIHLYPQWQSLRRYSPSLEELLSQKKWVQANDKTWEILINEGDRNQDGVLDKDEVSNLNCTTLKTIDGMWHSYSSENYGFEIQLRAYQGSFDDGGIFPSQTSNPSNYHRFANRVGWYSFDNNRWLTANDIYSQNSPQRGFFPVWFIYNKQWGTYPFGLPSQPYSLSRDQLKPFDSSGTRFANRLRYCFE